MARRLSAKDALQLVLASDSGEDLDDDNYGNSDDFSDESDNESLTDVSAPHSLVSHDHVAPTATGPGAGPNAHSENISTDSDSDVPTTIPPKRPRVTARQRGQGRIRNSNG